MTQRQDIQREQDPIGTEDLVAAERVSGGRPEDETPPRTQDDTALFEDADSERFRNRWHDVQAAFVDDPQRAVQDADQLVAELMQTLAATFAERKESLDAQWRSSGEAETEELRLALRRYRSFFDQLLPH